LQSWRQIRTGSLDGDFDFKLSIPTSSKFVPSEDEQNQGFNDEDLVIFFKKSKKNRF
jgi:hypothetical protein